MTAIAYRQGVMAADSLESDDGLFLGHSKKISRSPEGALGGAAGSLGACSAFATWFEKNGYRGSPFNPKEERGKFGALIVAYDGSRVYRMDWLGRLSPLNGPFHVEGYCFGFLMGAMAAGATAEEAVRLAIKHDGHCGGEVQVERLTTDPKPI